MKHILIEIILGLVCIAILYHINSAEHGRPLEFLHNALINILNFQYNIVTMSCIATMYT